MYVGVMTAFKELLEHEDVGLNPSVLLIVIGVVRLWLSKENLFAKLSLIGQINLSVEVPFLT